MTSHAIHPCKRRRLERLFRRGLSAASHRQLWSHLRHCAACRSYYESMREVEEVAHQGEGLSPGAMDRLASLVLPTAEPRAWTTYLEVWPAWVAAAGVAAMLLLAVASPSDLQGDAPAAKGGAAHLSEAAISLFEMLPEQGRVRPLARSATGDSAQPGVRVPVGTPFQIAYRNASWSRAFVVGLDAEGGVQWYHPADAQGAPAGVPIMTHVNQEPFGAAWRMTSPGALRIFAVFGNDSLEAAEIEQALQASRGRDLRQLRRLPVEAFQDSLLVEVTP